ncbi:hypothetical protein EDB86DRAFT_3064020 [Lactarius hatsudake]|nr:hypothetical protein EDB86DRAFT_3064020 [Lactarius hatsudake]
MAAPPDLTTLNLSGTWVMNKTLSDDTDEVLRLQGVGWWMRSAIALATVTLYVKHYKDESGVEHIEIDQRLTGGNRTLDWTPREHEDHLFGAVIGKSRRVKLDELDNEFLKKGWLQDTEQHGAINAYAQSDTPKSGKTWIAEQIWGFELVGDERRYVRHLDFLGPESEHIQARLVYDFCKMLTNSNERMDFLTYMQMRLSD